MKASDFIESAKFAASMRTVYAKGCFGQPITAKLISEKAKQYPSWYTAKKVSSLMSLVPFGYFGFDCVCLVKGLLWGWNADLAHRNGGADYKSNGVDDFAVDSILDHCTEVSDDFSKIVAGEVVYMPGHCGIYIGDGLVAEATASWERCVLISTINKEDTAHHHRTWMKHGKIEWVEYDSKKMVSVELPVLKRGEKSPQVGILQVLLNANRANPQLDVDGSFGAKTETALKKYQQNHGLEADGSCGKKTWTKILMNE